MLVTAFFLAWVPTQDFFLKKSVSILLQKEFYYFIIIWTKLDHAFYYSTYISMDKKGRAFYYSRFLWNKLGLAFYVLL
jgi:hypothetical protein